jgi:hypothetical protein
VLCGCLLVSARPVRAAGPCDQYLYIPPDLERSVVFYHSFSGGIEQPEINLLKAAIAGSAQGRRVPGLTGAAWQPIGQRGALSLAKLSWPLTKPITASLWFRLDEKMQPQTSFHLLSLRANGYLSNFVRGRGEWCALTQPTFVVQLYHFPGISNVNGIHFGPAWLAENQWHHAAMTVSEGSRVKVYWDGRLRSDLAAKGRLFDARDVVKEMQFGPHWLGHPMTIDEVLLLDRALTDEEVCAYVEAVRKLAEAGFPSQDASGSPPVSPDERTK